VSTFENALASVNNRAACDERIKDALNKYAGRHLVFNVVGDAVYSFKITPEKIEFNVTASLEEIPEDMYLEMDLERAKKLVYKRMVNPTDLLLGRIKWKNMSMSDVNFLRNLLSNY